MTDVRVDKALDGIVHMRNKRNDYQSSLHRAQHILLGVFGLLEDIDDAGRVDVALAGRITSMLNEVGIYLECEPFVQDPHAFELTSLSSDPAQADHGFAPDVQR